MTLISSIMILNEEKIERVTILLQNIIGENAKAVYPDLPEVFNIFVKCSPPPYNLVCVNMSFSKVDSRL